ncbi:hypothetical protein FC093_16710 [Ilyomonas limi]|uniref:Uncharacterized protein n=1 Tax=Ilyomonas limi TaxID=2575867 RepID=A0A4U3KZT4_9BACT|nr:hypothetical protein [Ilyomonas limi]TKK66677.1 hypothetical protein FC093_16710 [Ilyomonas limi]
MIIAVKRICAVALLLAVLCIAVNAQLSAPPSMSSAFGNFSQFISKSALKNVGNNNGNGAVNGFNNLENTQGKRFLFDTWVKGRVTTAQGSTVNSDSFAYNFDKTNGNLLATQNKVDILTIAPDNLQSFVLVYYNKTYSFEHVPVIDPTKVYLSLIKSTDKYSLYKLVGTTFIKANFRNDGISQSGNMYDEYKEDNQYYIIIPGGKAYKQVSLKRKAIIAALDDADKDKADAYFKQHRDEDVNENFLTEIILYLNK